MKRTLIAVSAVLTIALAACSSDQGGASAEATEAASAAASEAAESVAASPSAESSEFALPSGSFAIPSFDINGDPELAGRFPDTVGGQPLTVQSFRGDVFAGAGSSDPAFEEFLASVGADLEDVSVAFGGVATSTEEFFSVGAFRVVGASEDDLEREFLAASEEAGDVSDVTDANIGGKDVKTATDPSGEAGAQVFLYTKDDTLYFITGSEELAAEVLEALP